MQTVYEVGSTSFQTTLALANELRSRNARIISINRPIGFTYTGGGYHQRAYEIWFEHELATDPEWRNSVYRSAEDREEKGEVDEWAGQSDTRPVA